MKEKTDIDISFLNSIVTGALFSSYLYIYVL